MTPDHRNDHAAPLPASDPVAISRLLGNPPYVSRRTDGINLGQRCNDPSRAPVNLPRMDAAIRHAVVLGLPVLVFADV